MRVPVTQFVPRKLNIKVDDKDKTEEKPQEKAEEEDEDVNARLISEL